MIKLNWQTDLYKGLCPHCEQEVTVNTHLPSRTTTCIWCKKDFDVYEAWRLHNEKKTEDILEALDKYQSEAFGDLT